MKDQEPKKVEKAEAVADLEISSEQAQEIQGGATLPRSDPYSGFKGGVSVAVGDLN